MDGKELKRRLREIMNESTDSGWLDERTTYDFLYEAAVDFTDRTHCLKSSQTITTVADQTDYNLSPDFLKLYVKNSNNDLVIKWGDDTFITWKDHGDLIYGNQTSSISTPSNFTIADASLPSRVVGTATSAGAATGGACTLVDTAADFTNVEAWDSIHNTTDGSTGVVLSKTSTTEIETALFGGSANDWSNSDAYVVQPQGRYKIVIDPPPDGAETITVSYIRRPTPVYSDYQTYGILNQYSAALVKYAFWLYKYRDKEPNFGDGMYRYYDSATRKAGYSINQAFNRRMKVSFKGKR